MQETSWRGECDRIHDRCTKVQNNMRGHNLSSGPPSSARNVEGTGPTNMLGDLPSKKSQLDLRSFGLGVLAVGRMVLP